MVKRRLYNRFKITGHILFWLVSITLLLFIFSFYEERIQFNQAIKSIVTNFGFATAVYLNIYYLIPHFLKLKNYIFYIFWLIILITITSLLTQLLFLFPLRDILSITDHFTSFNSALHSAYFFATLVYVGATSFLKFIKEWLAIQDLNLKIEKIERQKLEAELKSLKGQLNPHFLFNSLNNIYSLALIKSNKVPDLILKLSDLMRHIIYESKENYIPIEKEIEFVNNFIALQKIRISDETIIQYNIDGNIPSGKIAPLLFEPFIDNAFKHGLPGIKNKDCISINFDFNKKDYIHFNIKNNFEEAIKWDKKHSGIGIENVKQRLKYLYEESEYELIINRENHRFMVSLKLKLK